MHSRCTYEMHLCEMHIYEMHSSLEMSANPHFVRYQVSMITRPSSCVINLPRSYAIYISDPSMSRSKYRKIHLQIEIIHARIKSTIRLQPVFHVNDMRPCFTNSLRLVVHVTTHEDDDEFDASHISVVCINFPLNNV
jgi:hypothetical protein